MSRRGWPARPCMQLPPPTCRRPRRMRESARAIDLAVYSSARARRARSSAQHVNFSCTAPPAGPSWACHVDMQGVPRPSSTIRSTGMVVLFFRRHARDLSPRAGRASRGAILVPRVRCSAALRQRARLSSHLRPFPEWHILRVRPALSVPRAAGGAWENWSAGVGWAVKRPAERALSHARYHWILLSCCTAWPCPPRRDPPGPGCGNALSVLCQSVARTWAVVIRAIY